MKLTHAISLALALGSLSLVPSLARADAPPDCLPPVVTITMPSDGAIFEGVTEIPVTFTVESDRFSELEQAAVLVDEVEAATMNISMDGTYEVSVAVTEGSHQLVAAVVDGCLLLGFPVYSEPVTIVVTAPAGASTGEATSGDGSGGSTTGEATSAGGSGETTAGSTTDASGSGGSSGGGCNEDDGCTISRTPTRSWVGLSAFALMVLGAWRLRRAGM